MSIEYKNIDTTHAYRALCDMYSSPLSLKQLVDVERVQNYHILCGAETGAIHYGYATKQVDANIVKLLQNLADEQQVIAKYSALYNGEFMNTGENRRVLHHLSRGQLGDAVYENERDLGAFYMQQQEKCYAFAHAVHTASVVSSSGKPFTAVVQIGIGGSDLGPRALYLAMREYAHAHNSEHMPAYFISNVDPDDAMGVLRHIDPQRTLFVLVSKSGTTQETLANECLVIQYLRDAGIVNPKKNIVCVTSETSILAKSDEYLDSFFIDDYIGGRYSALSPVGLCILSLAFGAAIVKECVAGAHAMDVHATNECITENAPLMDALIGVYERSVLQYATTAVLPYSQALSRFAAHLQQVDMESNGKQVNRFGDAITYETGPILFGEPGTNGQHSFYQLLHQGTTIIPLQFIGFARAQQLEDVQLENSSSHDKLVANLFAQIFAFALGAENSDANKCFFGERPSSLLWAKQLSPRVLGALLSHYENKIMFQGFLWNVNSFDQEGVQLGKVLTQDILKGDITSVMESFMDIYMA